jgi:hypothetical protein
VNSPVEGEENPTAFFNFEKHEEAMAKEYMGFRKINEETLKKVCHPDYKPQATYRINKEGCFTLLEDPAKIQ